MIHWPNIDLNESIFLFNFQTMLPIIFGHVPSGASVKQMSHYGQEIDTKHFRQWDYGIFENMIHYNSLFPPDYNLRNVNAKTVLYYALNDGVVNVKDVQHLMLELPNVMASHMIAHKRFNHVDFIWGVDVRKLLYDNIISDIKRADAAEIHQQTNE